MPIHLHGGSQIRDRDGAVLLERAGTVLAPCGNRREAVCPACSDRYRTDAFHLLRAGLAGDESKNIPDTVADRPRMFLTLTAPSFGPVHTRTLTRRGHVIPCRCGERHRPDDPRVGTAVDPDTYDYQGAVLWQAHAGALWARFTTTLRRTLAAQLGVRAAAVLRARPAVLRQGRRVPTPRPGPLPRRPAHRRPRRTDRPATRRARPARVPRGHHRGGPRHHPHHRAAGRDTARAGLGCPARPTGGHPDRAPADRRPARRDHRPGPRRLHRQIRHQDHRRHRRRRPAHPRPHPHRAPAHPRPPPPHDQHRVGPRRPGRLRAG